MGESCLAGYLSHLGNHLHYLEPLREGGGGGRFSWSGGSGGSGGSEFSQ